MQLKHTQNVLGVIEAILPSVICTLLFLPPSVRLGPSVAAREFSVSYDVTLTPISLAEAVREREELNFANSFHFLADCDFPSSLAVFACL